MVVGKSNEDFKRKGVTNMMGKILKRMTGEELLLLRIRSSDDMAPVINAELDHRARADITAPAWSRAGRVGRTSRANWIAHSSKLAA